MESVQLFIEKKFEK